MASRRGFLGSAAVWAWSVPVWAALGAGEVRRAAIIGHTGRGDYGHGMEMIFRDRPRVEVVGVADADPAGWERMRPKFKGARGYSDWREMLKRERPQLVSIGMRHTDQHFEVAMGCLKAGVHVYLEKPFVSFPAEADALLLEAKRRRLKVGVAHTQRATMPARELRQAIVEGVYGNLLEMRAHGKQDSRAGGEDLMVLGTHLFDLMRLFAGDPLACTGRVLAQGRPITVKDRRRVLDHVGWVAGDDVSAQFEFPGGVVGTFQSKEAAREVKGPWGMELVFSRARVRFNSDVDPNVFVMTGKSWTAQGRVEEWKPMLRTQLREVPLVLDPVGDWLEATLTDREPECSGANGAWAVEMVMAVYASAISGKRVTFPLSSRTHPLG